MVSSYEAKLAEYEKTRKAKEELAEAEVAKRKAAERLAKAESNVGEEANAERVDELAKAKEAVEEAELAFRALEVECVSLADGTKVAIVNQSRRSIDN